MKTILLCVFFEHPLVASCLIFAVMVIILAIVICCYLKKKAHLLKAMADAGRKHELDMKDKAFEKEKYWFLQNKIESDFKREIEDKLKKLSKEI